MPNCSGKSFNINWNETLSSFGKDGVSYSPESKNFKMTKLCQMFQCNFETIFQIAKYFTIISNYWSNSDFLKSITPDLLDVFQTHKFWYVSEQIFKLYNTPSFVLKKEDWKPEDSSIIVKEIKTQIGIPINQSYGTKKQLEQIKQLEQNSIPEKMNETIQKFGIDEISKLLSIYIGTSTENNPPLISSVINHHDIELKIGFFIFFFPSYSFFSPRKFCKIFSIDSNQ